MLVEDEDIFALSGGTSRTGAQVFRGAERAAKALIRHYRRHSHGDNWNVAFVRLTAGETNPVSFTGLVRQLFADDENAGVKLQSGSRGLAEWESRMTRVLLEMLSKADASS